jgi:hypothetical protein
MLTAEDKGTEHFMPRQSRLKEITPAELTRRLLAYEAELGMDSQAAFCRFIGVREDSISPQMMSNWKGGQDISLLALLRMKPVVQARLLLDRPAEEDLLREGRIIGLAEARKALERLEAQVRAEGSKRPARDMAELQRAAPRKQAPKRREA